MALDHLPCHFASMAWKSGRVGGIVVARRREIVKRLINSDLDLDSKSLVLHVVLLITRVIHADALDNRRECILQSRVLRTPKTEGLTRAGVIA